MHALSHPMWHDAGSQNAHALAALSALFLSLLPASWMLSFRSSAPRDTWFVRGGEGVQGSHVHCCLVVCGCHSVADSSFRQDGCRSRHDLASLEADQGDWHLAVCQLNNSVHCQLHRQTASKVPQHQHTHQPLATHRLLCLIAETVSITSTHRGHQATRHRAGSSDGGAAHSGAADGGDGGACCADHVACDVGELKKQKKAVGG